MRIIIRQDQIQAKLVLEDEQGTIPITTLLFTISYTHGLMVYLMISEDTTWLVNSTGIPLPAAYVDQLLYETADQFNAGQDQITIHIPAAELSMTEPDEEVQELAHL